MSATYPLSLIKKLIDSGCYTVTETAATTAKLELGLNFQQIIENVKALKAGEFYKTMQSEKKAGLWQDVYRQKLTINKKQVLAYVKLQVTELPSGQRAVIISYKLL